MRGLLRHTGPELIGRGLISDRDGIECKKDKQRHDEKLNERIITHFVQQGSVTIIISVGYIGIVAELHLQWPVLASELIQLPGEPRLILSRAGGVDIYIIN